MKISILFISMIFMACAARTTGIQSSSSCSAKVVNGQKEVVCTDGTGFDVNDGTDGSNGVNGTNGVNGNAGQNGINGTDGTNGMNGYSIGTISEIATQSQCANGGQVLEFYQDVNYSGAYASNDPITSQVTICNGLNGTDGLNGVNGTDGINGSNGTNSSITVSVASQTQCANGGLSITTLNGAESSTSVVCNGATGPQGETGPQGLQGIQGLSGVSAVQFCPNYAASYPNVFPEFGLCVNNAIYAVYWDNKNAWLAEVVPGYYSSTSTSAPCNFTVTLGCNISN